MAAKQTIVAIWPDGSVKSYATLPAFLEKNPEPKRSRETIQYYLSRLNEPYKDEHVTLHRCEIIRAAGGLKTKK